MQRFFPNLLISSMVLILGVQVLGYPPQERLMPDGAPIPEDTVEHEDSLASASDVVEEYDDGDDSDMYMEPDGAETMTADHAENHTLSPEGHEEESNSDKQADTIMRDEQKDSGAEKTQSTDQDAKTSEEQSKTESPVEEETESKSLETDSQNFFPAFADLFANQRAPYDQQQQQQQRFRPNRFLSYFQRDRPAYQASASTNKDIGSSQHAILGSGNFGVIRGGTYYPEDKENDEYSIDESLYSPYYHGSSNIRARANYYRNPKPQPIRGGDFFANFRDFADITAPPKSSFSHLSVVYANRNGTTNDAANAKHRITEPRNIIETLRMLEEEDFERRLNSAFITTTTSTESPTKKLSKGKRKLVKIRQYEENKAKRTIVPIEPLLALS